MLDAVYLAQVMLCIETLTHINCHDYEVDVVEKTNMKLMKHISNIVYKACMLLLYIKIRRIMLSSL